MAVLEIVGAGIVGMAIGRLIYVSWRARNKVWALIAGLALASPVALSTWEDAAMATFLGASLVVGVGLYLLGSPLSRDVVSEGERHSSSIGDGGR